MNYFTRKNYLKTNLTKIRAVALEFYKQNPEMASDEDEAVESFHEAVLGGHISKQMIDKVYSALLKGEKLLLTTGDTLESVVDEERIKEFIEQNREIR